jgi:hypothetical protein
MDTWLFFVVSSPLFLRLIDLLAKLEAAINGLYASLTSSLSSFPSSSWRGPPSWLGSPKWLGSCSPLFSCFCLRASTTKLVIDDDIELMDRSMGGEFEDEWSGCTDKEEEREQEGSSGYERDKKRD